MPAIPMQRPPVKVASHRPRHAAVPAAPRSPRSGPTPARGALSAVLDVVGRLGSVVTLSALVVVAAAVGGAVAGQPADGALSVTVQAAP